MTNHRFEDIASGIECRITTDEPGILHGLYRVIVLKK